MHGYRMHTVLAVAAGVGAMVLGTVAANAQANCQWYATTALKQQQENERLKCGFTGQAWNSDLKAHMTWCGSVAPDAWKAQAVKRDQDLAACAAKAKK